MALPVFTVGKLRASQLTDVVSFLAQTAVMASNQALTASSTVFQSITELALPVAANRTYTGLLTPVWSLATGTAEDIKFTFTFPSGATLDFGGTGPAFTLGAATSIGDADFVTRIGATSGTTFVPYGASTSVTTALIAFTLTVGATPGATQVQAAQNTSGANVVTVLAGSRMLMNRVS